jgi:hypothetical protein
MSATHLANRLVISSTPTCWVATYEGPHAQEIQDAFGTPTLPLPYRDPYPAENLLADLRLSHPGVDVVLAGAEIDYRRKIRTNEV